MKHLKESRMNRNGTCSAAPRSYGGLGAAVLSAGLALLLAAAPLRAQGQPDPKDWDYDIRTDKSTYAAGDTVKATSGVVARKAGVQGWSYGVRHDPALLTIESATTDGTDVPSVFNAGFNQTAIIEEAGGVKSGFIQAVVLSLVGQAEVPVSDYFSMAAINYTVNKDACQGKSGDLKTKIDFSETLAVKGGPPVELNLTILGIGIVPEKVLGEELTVACTDTPPPEGLVLRLDDKDTDLPADQKSVYDLKILLANEDQATTEVQGWSYGVRMDLDEVEAISGAPGADSQALHGGAGPDFKSYNLDQKSADGKERGVTVGAVIDLDAPGTEVLTLGSGQTKHLDTIMLRSRETIPEGGSSRDVTIGFSDKLGDDRPLEVLIVVEGDGIVPDFGDTLELTLTPSGPPGAQPFIRGDANDDEFVDIADGIWIINELFYDGPETECKAAADANDDDRIDIADSMYIFNHQLQPGRQSTNLFPAPPAPYPNCGTATSALACPAGSTSCAP
jgi:hypothetical protein